MSIKHLAVIGIGLIGGSLARALKRANVCDRVTGCALSEDECLRAVELGVIDDYHLDPAEAIKGADCIVIATPIGAYEALFTTLQPVLNDQVVITDVGSVKGVIVDQARQHLGQHFSQFVPGHPIAGTEKSGVEASFAELFDHHRIILTPLSETDPHALEKIRRMWMLAGALVDVMEVERHDEVLAATSHVPHVLAYSLVSTLSGMEASGEVFRFAAGGFADFTRIASSSPKMWHDIVFSNKEAVIRVLESYEDSLESLKKALETGDSETVMAMLTQAKTARDLFADNRIKRHVSPSTEKGEE